MKYNVISADAHVNDPPETWSDRVPHKFKDGAPRVVARPDGGEGWKFPDEAHIGSFRLGSATLQMGAARGPERYITDGLKFEDVAGGSGDPKHHIENMRTHGCDASVLYIGVAASVYNIKDHEPRLARPFAFGHSGQESPLMANQVMRDFSYCTPFADLIFGGVFERFSKLKGVSREGRPGRLVHFVQRAESIRRHGPLVQVY